MMMPLLAQAADSHRLVDLLVNVLIIALIILAGVVLRGVVLLTGRLTRLMDEVAKRVAELSKQGPALPAATAPSIAAPAPVVGLALGPVPTAAPMGEIPPQTLAIIAAAATAMLGGDGGNVVIRQVTRATVGPSSWAQMGRMGVQTSHNVRPRSH